MNDVAHAVSKTVHDAWCKRDYGLRSDELKAVIELALGACPSRGRSERHLYATRVFCLLPTCAKRSRRNTASMYMAATFYYLFGGTPE